MRLIDRIFTGFEQPLFIVALQCETKRGIELKTPPATAEFATFTTAMRDILKVSKGEMKARMEAHKESGKRLSKGSASLGSGASAKIRSAISGR